MPPLADKNHLVFCHTVQFRLYRTALLSSQGKKNIYQNKATNPITAKYSYPALKVIPVDFEVLCPAWPEAGIGAGTVTKLAGLVFVTSQEMFHLNTI